MSNHEKFVNPDEALIMGSFFRYEPERKPQMGGVFPPSEREVVVLSWVEDGKVREGTLEGTKVHYSSELSSLRKWRTAGDWAEVPKKMPAKMRLWHGPPDRSGEIFAERTSCPKDFELTGKIVGEFVRYVPISKSGRRRPRIIPFVVVRGLEDNQEYVCRVQNGEEWETTPTGQLLPQLRDAHTRLMEMYPLGVSTISPFGRGGYWQVSKFVPNEMLSNEEQIVPGTDEAILLKDLTLGLTEAVICATT